MLKSITYAHLYALEGGSEQQRRQQHQHERKIEQPAIDRTDQHQRLNRAGRNQHPDRQGTKQRAQRRTGKPTERRHQHQRDGNIDVGVGKRGRGPQRDGHDQGQRQQDRRPLKFKAQRAPSSGGQQQTQRQHGHAADRTALEPRHPDLFERAQAGAGKQAGTDQRAEQGRQGTAKQQRLEQRRRLADALGGHTVTAQQQTPEQDLDGVGRDADQRQQHGIADHLPGGQTAQRHRSEQQSPILVGPRLKQRHPQGIGVPEHGHVAAWSRQQDGGHREREIQAADQKR
jgi:hypothetical protein